MEDYSITAKGDQGPIPADNPTRTLTVADPSGASARVIWVVGDTYTILISGKDTAGRYCLIDMLVPDGSGPPPHRHDFEETFVLLKGELEFTFRGHTQTVAAPSTVNIPANAPHVFKNKSGKTVHMLCQCVPAGQDEFFMATGVPMTSRDAPPPELNAAEKKAKGDLAKDLAPKYRNEFLDSA